METENHPLFSIIVPVYNVENYIEYTINSLLSQTYENFEILAIDDGSTDGSGQILDNFAPKDNRLKVFHKENGGVSSARNVGLEKSTGEWIIFVDGDDGLKTNALQILYEVINKKDSFDVIGYGKEFVFNVNEKPGPTSYTINLIYDNKKEVGFNILNHYTVWSLAIKHTIIQDLRFQPLRNGEDVLFCNSIAFKADHYVELNSNIYLYLKYRQASAMTLEWDLKRHEDYHKLHKGILKNIKNSSKTINVIWLRRWIGTLLTFNKNTENMDTVQRDLLFRNHRELIKEVLKVPEIPIFLKFWLKTSIIFDSYLWFKFIAMKPMELYSKMNK